MLALVYERLDRPSFREIQEPSITGELVRSMKEVLELEDAPDWAIPLCVADDPPQNVEGRLGKRRRRIDIEVERAGRGKRPRFHFEAKRLHDSSSLGAYVGIDGLQLFVRGIYSPDSNEAGMLGYVQAGTCSFWARELKKRLAANPGKYKLRADGSLTRILLARQLGESHRSRHDRPNPKGPISIFHTFLLFC